MNQMTIIDNNPPAPVKAEKIKFDYDALVWIGLSPQHPNVLAWMEAYPNINLGQEFSKMKAWLISNKDRSRKKNFTSFINNWLNRANDSALRANKGKTGKENIGFVERHQDKSWADGL